jgi:hypothetical protein
MKHISILTVATCMAVSMYVAQVFAATDGDRPNILFILADDLGFKRPISIDSQAQAFDSLKRTLAIPSVHPREFRCSLGETDD